MVTHHPPGNICKLRGLSRCLLTLYHIDYLVEQIGMSMGPCTVVLRRAANRVQAARLRNSWWPELFRSHEAQGLARLGPCGRSRLHQRCLESCTLPIYRWGLHWRLVLTCNSLNMLRQSPRALRYVQVRVVRRRLPLRRVQH